MSLEAILTVLTVVLAALAIIPQERGQDLRLRLGGTASVVVALAAGLVLYWSLLEPLHALPWIRDLPRRIHWLHGWDPASGSLAVFVLVTSYCWWTYERRLPVGRLPKLASVFSGALARRRFAESAHLLEAHIGSIRTGLEGSYWQAQLRRRLFPTIAELHLMAVTAHRLAAHGAKDGDAAGDAAALFSPPAPLLSMPVQSKPSQLSQCFIDLAERPTDAANDIVRSLSHSTEFVRYVASANPYLGLALAQLPSTWILREFTETFARALLSEPESILYFELRRAVNVDLNSVPIVNRSDQPLLVALCDDATRHDGPRSLHTFLEAGLDALRGANSETLRAELNQALDDYHKRRRWSSPPFAVIYLLAVTAPRNAVSAEAQNLNLYILSSLTSELLQVLSPASGVDLTREWPTPIHYLLYECVSLLVDIIRIWKDRPSDIPSDKLADVRDGLPRILPAHAIEVLGSVMENILKSERLEPRFKGYLMEVWWGAYWSKYEEAWEHSDAVLEGLLRGGHFGPPGMRHREGLAEALPYVDIMIQMSGGNAVRAAFNLPPA